MSNSTFLIIAIDFGTAYSGYCYSVRSNPDEIRSPVWGEEYGQSTQKTPTCILFDQRENFCLFGYDALMTYKMDPKSKHIFFHNFKMNLYNKTISRDMMIMSCNHKPMLAMKVFSESLCYLKDHALDTIAQNTSGKKFVASDVTWVLTVPAIWDPAAKQFMREAATKAGLVTTSHSSDLIIALEPEAASLRCRQLKSTGFIDEGTVDSLEHTSGVQYIVVDCGGGTVDIAVHEVLEGGSLKEIYKASGGSMGGGNVNAKFQDSLRDIFHHTLWDKYKKDSSSELQKMMLDFNQYKCVKNKGDIYIPCPYKLTKLAEKKQEMQNYFKDVDGVFWIDGTIKITYDKLKTYFTESLTKMTDLLQAIFATPEMNIDYMFLVGGYACSEILQTEIKRQFGQRCQVLCPVDAQLAVAKGAVLMGKNPQIISSRICALTYGISVCRKFDPQVHKKEKRRENTAKDYIYCTDLFHRFVENGESVERDSVREYYLSPVDDDQTGMFFRIFSTEESDAVYTDGLKNIGSFTVDMPDISKGRDRSVKFEMKFGLTEIEATATDLTSNRTTSVRLDFLTR